MRFYAGVPLSLNGRHRTGTPCLIDYLPRELDAGQKERLKDLARMVEKEIDTG